MDIEKRCDLCGVGETWTTSDGAIWLKCVESRIIKCRLHNPVQSAANCKRFRPKSGMTAQEISELRGEQKSRGFY